MVFRLNRRELLDFLGLQFNQGIEICALTFNDQGTYQLLSLLHEVIPLGFELLIKLRHVVALELRVDLLQLVGEEIGLQRQSLNEVLVRLYSSKFKCIQWIPL